MAPALPQLLIPLAPPVGVCEAPICGHSSDPCGFGLAGDCDGHTRAGQQWPESQPCCARPGAHGNAVWTAPLPRARGPQRTGQLHRHHPAALILTQHRVFAPPWGVRDAGGFPTTDET